MTSSLRLHLPADDSTPPDGHRLILRLSHGCASPSSRRSRYPNHPGFVWPVARLIDPWALEWIVQAVASYTRLGDRVLPFASPSDPAAPTPGAHATPGNRSGGGLLPALIEAAGTVRRLGSAVGVHFVDPRAVAWAVEETLPTKGQSAHRLPPESVRPVQTDHRPVRRWQALTAVGADCPDAVVAPVEPRYPDWGARVFGSVRPEPSALLACATHGKRGVA